MVDGLVFGVSVFALVVTISHEDISGPLPQKHEVSHTISEEAALINSIVHFDINAPGNIIIEQTDNQLKFSNPGILLMSVEQFFNGGRSICRNPHLQNMFIHLSRSEKAGSGVDKILKGWRELGWATPIIKEDIQPDYVVLTLPIGVGDKTGVDTENDIERTVTRQPKELLITKAIEILTQKMTQKMTQKISYVIGLICDDETISTIKMSESLKVSRSSISRIVRLLQENGILRRKGADKGGTWEITL